jgi:hypothetical protein
MKKEKLIIALSALFFACGSNAENQKVRAVKTEEVGETLSEEMTIKEEVVLNEAILTEKVIEETLEISTEKNIEKVEQEVAVVEALITPDEFKESEVTVNEVAGGDIEIVMLDHKVWNSILKKNVNTTGRVNYKEMKVALPLIENYLKSLKENAPKNEWSKNEKLAYWINLYNASTVYLIASNYPISSITKLNGGKPWDKKFVKSGEKLYSLNQIENEIVRPQFKDPRIHAALNCAAISCPNLLNEAFTAAYLNNQMNKQCMVWANDISKNKLTENKVEVSQIFDWYATDFNAGGGVVAFINKYATTKVSPKAKVSFSEYNWALNE